jgi:hypothetical protein
MWGTVHEMRVTSPTWVGSETDIMMDDGATIKHDSWHQRQDRELWS